MVWRHLFSVRKPSGHINGMQAPICSICAAINCRVRAEGELVYLEGDGKSNQFQRLKKILRITIWFAGSSATVNRNW